jgi:hypothetical protein
MGVRPGDDEKEVVRRGQRAKAIERIVTGQWLFPHVIVRSYAAVPYAPQVQHHPSGAVRYQCYCRQTVITLIPMSVAVCPACFRTVLYTTTYVVIDEPSRI